MTTMMMESAQGSSERLLLLSRSGRLACLDGSDGCTTFVGPAALPCIAADGVLLITRSADDADCLPRFAVCTSASISATACVVEGDDADGSGCTRWIAPDFGVPPEAYVLDSGDAVSADLEGQHGLAVQLSWVADAGRAAAFWSPQLSFVAGGATSVRPLQVEAPAPFRVFVDGIVTKGTADDVEWESEFGDVVVAAWAVYIGGPPGSTAKLAPVRVELPRACTSAATACSSGAFFFVSEEESFGLFELPSTTDRVAFESRLLGGQHDFLLLVQQNTPRSPAGDTDSAVDEEESDTSSTACCWCTGSSVRHHCGAFVPESAFQRGDASSPCSSSDHSSRRPTPGAPDAAAGALVVVPSPGSLAPNPNPTVGTAPRFRSTPPAMGMPYLKPSWGVVSTTTGGAAASKKATMSGGGGGGIAASLVSPGGFVQAVPPAMSHFFETFELEGFLGRGAEGQVLKARHRLTGVQYAVKAIPLKSDRHAAQVLQEVNLLARVKHPNIVQYYHSWAEDVPKTAVERLEEFARAHGMPQGADEESLGAVDSLTDSSIDESVSITLTSDAQPTVSTGGGTRTIDCSTSGGSPLTTFNSALRHLLATDSPHNVKVLFVLMDMFPSSLHELLARRNAAAVKQKGRPRQSSPHLDAGFDHVFDPSTGVIDRVANLAVMLDTLNGLQHLHDQGVVHRDVKPANIFVNPATLHAAVGDLGLAKLLQCDDGDSACGSGPQSPNVDHGPEAVYGAFAKGGGAPATSTSVGGAPTNPSTTSTNAKLVASLRETLDVVLTASHDRRSAALAAHAKSRRDMMTGAAPSSAVATPAMPKSESAVSAHTKGVGSPLYAAPEQLAGSRCDSLCDAFAAGLVFLEMYCTFGTAMERVATLRSAGSTGELNPFTLAEFPELLIAEALLTPNRRARLSVRQARSLVKTALLRLQEKQERDAEAALLTPD